jgi:phage terminase Nu1 subunit (DNA packaging protein)
MADDIEALFDLANARPETELPQNGPQKATEAELAAFWAVSSRQVRKLLSDGVIQKAEGRYDVQLCTQNYLRHLSLKRQTTNPNLEAEKLRLTREQADAVELKNAEKRGEMVSAADVKSTWSGILRDLRAGLLAIPSRVQTRLPHLTSHDIKTIDSEIRDVLTEIASGDS